MKRGLSFAVVALIVIGLSGCGKKQEAEELQPITLESLSSPSGANQVMPDLREQDAAKALTPVPVSQVKEVLPVPPQGPYRPSGMEIQTALKNAGFYNGKIDGKIGPMSKKAIEDFQKSNNLKADGKVGPKTWEAMSKFTASTVKTN